MLNHFSRVSILLPLFSLLLIVNSIATCAQNAPTKSDYVEGQLQVLVPEGKSLIYIIEDADGKPTSVALNSSALPYAGYTVRILPDTSSTTSTPGSDPNARRRLQTNTTGTPRASALPGSNPVPVRSFSVVSEPPPAAVKEGTAAGARNITSVVFLLSFCGYKPAVDAETFRSFWLNQDGDKTPPGAYTMQNYWAGCSQGLARMSKETQTIVEVPLPCDGAIALTTYNFSNQCTEVELYAAMGLADTYVRTQLGVDISGVKQRVAVLPREMSRACPWAGLASVGCLGPRCYTWISGFSASDLTLYHHEMGHNLGLMHSGRAGSSYEYGDYTCTMGSSSGCYNAPNLWKLGWAKPIRNGDLNATNFGPVGVWLPYQLPYSTRALENHLRIVPSWSRPALPPGPMITASAWPSYHVSLRLREGFDNLLPFWVPSPGRVAVHSGNLTQAANSYQRPRLETLLDVGQMFRLPMPLGFTVRVDWIDSVRSGAGVSVCRAERDAESRSDDSCSDGLDNDCDGLSDDKDPDCGGQVGTTSSPLPPPPPPPARSPPPPGRSPSPVPPPPLVRSPPPPPSPPPQRPTAPRPPSPPPPSPRPPSPRPPSPTPPPPPGLPTPPNRPPSPRRNARSPVPARQPPPPPPSLPAAPPPPPPKRNRVKKNNGRRQL